MIKKRKIVRSTQLQLGKLLDYNMSNSRDFANGEYTGPMGKRQSHKEWENLQSILNDAGPAKTVEQWKNTWRDMRKRAREEGALVKRAKSETGNLPVPEISPQSALILNIIGTACSTGIGNSETGVGELTTGEIETAMKSPTMISSPQSSFRHWMDNHPGQSSGQSPQFVFSPSSHLPQDPQAQQTDRQTDPKSKMFYVVPIAPVKPPPTSTVTSQAAHQPPTSSNFLLSSQSTHPPPTPTSSKRRNPGPSDFFNIDRENAEVLKEINTNLKDLSRQKALKNRREHNEKLRARRFMFKF